MKKARFLFLFLLIGCTGTDVVEDKLTALRIVVPGQSPATANGLTRLIGKKAQLAVEATSNLGGIFKYTRVTWKTSDRNIVRIDAKGLLQTLRPGNATITATASGISSKPFPISVAADLNSIAIIEITSTSGNSVIKVGATLQLSARALNVQRSVVEGAKLQWSSNNTEVATVDNKGLVTGRANGKATIRVAAGSRTGVFNVMVGDVKSLSRKGSFSGRNGYDVSGDVTLNSNKDGSLNLVLEKNFKAQSGPGLYIYLSNSDKSVSGGINLGKLKSSSGTSTYQVPEGTELTDYNYVIVHCKPFNVVFGASNKLK